MLRHCGQLNCISGQQLFVRQRKGGCGVGAGAAIHFAETVWSAEMVSSACHFRFLFTNSQRRYMKNDLWAGRGEGKGEGDSEGGRLNLCGVTDHWGGVSRWTFHDR